MQSGVVAELGRVKATQVQMTRRIGQRWPKEREEWADFSRLVWQVVAAEGRLVAPHVAPAEHHRKGGRTNRLNRGHRLLGKRRWDDTIQATVDAVVEVPWHCHAQNRDEWKYLEKSFTARLLRRQASGLSEVPTGRHTLRQWNQRVDINSCVGKRCLGKRPSVLCRGSLCVASLYRPRGTARRWLCRNPSICFCVVGRALLHSKLGKTTKHIVQEPSDTF